MYEQFVIMDRPTISPTNCDTNRDACPSEPTYFRLLGKQSKGLVFAPMGALRLLQYHHVSSVIVQSVSSLFHTSGSRLVQSTVWMGSGQTFLAVCWDVTDRIPDFREPSFSVLGSRGITKCTPLLYKSRPLKGAEEHWNVPVQSSDSFFARIEHVVYGWDKRLSGETEGLAAILFSVRYVGWGSKCKRNRPSLSFRQGIPVVFKYTLIKKNAKSQARKNKSC